MDSTPDPVMGMYIIMCPLLTETTKSRDLFFALRGFKVCPSLFTLACTVLRLSICYTIGLVGVALSNGAGYEPIGYFVLSLIAC